uniref:Uncharacterized protein n=1 Tax=Myoviridae sp. ctcyQ27 TaxID=2825139 RepID=A0A8S5UFD2_9CAUD|nr:MAG TPA: hypothetical protein [Myoviridae sp. ctcyQ27]
MHIHETLISSRCLIIYSNRLYLLFLSRYYQFTSSPQSILQCCFRQKIKSICKLV